MFEKGDRAAARRIDAARRTAAAGWRGRAIDRRVRSKRTSIGRGPPSESRAASNAVHRLNRTEYNNAIRDLFALDLDVKSLLPGDETADGSFDNFADVADDLDGASRALPVGGAPGDAARDRPAAREPRRSRRSRFRCTSCRTIGRAKTCRSDRAAASPCRHHFPVDGEYLDQGPSAAAVSGLPDGHGLAAAARRPARRQAAQAIHRRRQSAGTPGRAPATPATASPALPATPEWETYMQIDGDAGLEVRVPVDGGPARGRRLVRARAVGAGRPAAAAAARPRLTNDQIYMGYASVGSVQIGGPVSRSRGPAKDTPSRRAIFVCEPRSRGPTNSACADDDPVAHGPAGLSAAGDERGRRDAARVLRPAADATAEASTPAFSSRSSGCSWIPISCCASIASRRRHPATRRLSPERPRARVAVVVLSVEQHPGRAPARRWPSADSSPSPRCSNSEVRRMLADPTRHRRAGRRLRRPVAEPAPRRRSRRPSRLYPNFDDSLLEAFKQETELFVASTHPRGSQRRSICCAPTTRSSTNGWRGTTGFRAFTAAASGGSRCPNPDQRGGLLAHGALLATTSYPDRTSPVLRGKWLLDNIFGLPVPPPPPGVDTNLPDSQAGRRAADDSRAAGAAPQQSVVRSCHAAIDPPGSRWRISTRSAAGARGRIGQAGRRGRRTVTAAHDRRPGRAARAAAGGARSVSRDRHGKTAGLRAWAGGSSITIGRRCEDRPRRGGARLPLVVDHSGNREEPAVS